MPRNLESAASAKRMNRYPYYVLGVLWAVALFRLIDLQIIAVLLESIRTEMGFTDTQLGLLSGFAFGLFYAVLGIPIAWLADRYSRKSILSICLALWSVMTALCGAAVGYVSFFLARMGVGVGEAGGYPPSTSLLSDYFPPHRRGFAFAVLGSAIPVGVFVAFIVGGLINEHYGWRAAYFAVGIPGVLLALLVALTVREPQRGASERSVTVGGTKEPFVDTVRSLLGNRAYCWVVAGAAFHMMAATGSGIWVPSVFVRVHGMGSAEVGTWMGVMYGAGGLAGTLLGGVLADSLSKRYGDTRCFMRVCSVSMLCLLPFATVAFTTSSLTLALVAHSFVIVLMHMNVGPTLALVQNLVGVQRRSMSQAINVLASNLIGLSLGPLIVGFLSDRLTPVYGSAALGYAVVFIYVSGYLPAAAAFLRAERAGERGVRASAPAAAGSVGAANQ